MTFQLFDGENLTKHETGSCCLVTNAQSRITSRSETSGTSLRGRTCASTNVDSW